MVSGGESSPVDSPATGGLRIKLGEINERNKQMKKIMMAAAIVCAAAAVQAATINWSAQNTYLCNSEGTIQKSCAENTSIVLIALTSGDMTAWNNGTWNAAAGTVTEYQAGTVIAMGTIGKVNGSYTYSLGDSGEPANGTVLAMVFKDRDGSYRQMAYYDSTAESGIGEAITTTATVAGLKSDTDAFTAAFASATAGTKMLPGWVQATPEPTSGLLLLIGMAGLALRRRRA